ncbi:MAG: Asp-tRNA(Asn)/Glu-tRNA(Gln) amidotransferase subunit GatC [Clostridiaceae bacterium]|nr:Asp-tRNA(Asn)/Glu-tRNA(Gln) amidotransferase subunit GatC [Clostridiaceae bacterium]
MRITDELILDLEEQSKIRLSDSRRAEFKSGMEEFLVRADEMASLATDGVEPLYHLFPVTNVFRDDAVTNSDRSEKLLTNAPESKDRYFKVPQTLE